MVDIPLVNHKQVAIVDYNDFPLVCLYKWYLNSYGYARGYTANGFISMQKLLLGCPNEGYQIDHINGNRLDNRRKNLRFVTKRQNCLNHGLYATSTTGYNGVHWHKLAKKWIANIKVNNKLIHLGYFKTISQAVRKRKEADSFYGFKVENKKRFDSSKTLKYKKRYR